MIEIIIGILFLTGSLLMLIAAIGLLKFKDTISRMHATTKSPSLGILLIIIAVILYFSSLLILLKAILIMHFIYLTAPLAAHAISKLKS